jgi:diguanylate cyclase
MSIGSVVTQPQVSAAAAQLAVLLDQAEEARLRGDYRAGSDFAGQGAALAEQAGDGVGQARALRSLATQLLRLGDQEASITACSDAVALLEAAGNEKGICETLTLQAMPYNELGLHQEALEALARAHEIAQRLGDRGRRPWSTRASGTRRCAWPEPPDTPSGTTTAP